MKEEEKWVLPERLRKSEAETRARLDLGLDAGDSDFAAYYHLRCGDLASVRKHAIADARAAKAYVEGLDRALRHHGYAWGTAVLDAGCGPGDITRALAEVTKADCTGLDISQDAIDHAIKQHADASHFVCASIDEIQLPPGALTAIHAREFYPFTRVMDAEYVLRHLALFHRLLAPLGIVVMTQGDLPRGLMPMWNDLQSPIRAMGYASARRWPLIPWQISRFGGPVAYKAGVRHGFVATAALAALARRSHTQSYYVLQKGPTPHP